MYGNPGGCAAVVALVLGDGVVEVAFVLPVMFVALPVVVAVALLIVAFVALTEDGDGALWLPPVVAAIA